MREYSGDSGECRLIRHDHLLVTYIFSRACTYEGKRDERGPKTFMTFNQTNGRAECRDASSFTLMKSVLSPLVARIAPTAIPRRTVL